MKTRKRTWYISVNVDTLEPCSHKHQTKSGCLRCAWGRLTKGEGNMAGSEVNSLDARVLRKPIFVINKTL